MLASTRDRDRLVFVEMPDWPVDIPSVEDVGEGHPIVTVYDLKTGDQLARFVIADGVIATQDVALFNGQLLTKTASATVVSAEQ